MRNNLMIAWLCNIMKPVSMAALFVLAPGCGESAEEGPVTDVAPDDTAESQSFEGRTAEAPADGIGPDVEVTQTLDSAFDAPSPETLPACQPGNGCFLDPCETGADCASGLCVEHMGNSVCTQTCIEECPDGWLCRLLEGGQDPMFVCLSPYTNLCRPCAAGADCKSPTGLEDVCVAYGPQGNFCGASCGEGACPGGFSCSDVMSTNGTPVQQCVSAAGECECSKKAIALGLATPCFRKNDWGTCTGMRACLPEGLEACDAAEPAEEICDGLDNDCDAQVDEALCEDDNPCTEDSCNGVAGCAHEPLTGTECADGDVCTLADHCVDGTCTGSSISCDDNNICTDDGCNPTGGCLFVNNNTPCDDGDPCTVADACAEGKCGGFVVPCECDADSDCAALEDGDLCNGTLFCDHTGFLWSCAVVPGSPVVCPEPAGPEAECLAPSCDPGSGLCSFVPKAQGNACDDSNPCTVGETCADGACGEGLAPNCNDGNPCTTDSCDPAQGCAHENNQAPCNDGNPCTIADLCGGGACLPGKPLACDDGNVCTDDSCDPESGCLHAANTLPCDDNNSCTVGDQCTGGACAGIGSLECDDGNPCTKDICLPGGGCKHELVSGSCSDGNPCTVGDKCAGGSCSSGAPLKCDDGNPCTYDSCTAAGQCQFEPNKAACDDDNPCTTGDHCLNAACEPAGWLDCDDANPCTTDYCNPAQGCVHTPNNLPCSDENACTVGDACEAGGCQAGKPLACDDGNVCTTDGCQPGAGCTHTPAAAACDDSNPCTALDLCSNGICLGTAMTDCGDGNLCTDDSCDPLSGCVHAANANPCDDKDLCTINDTCSDKVCAGAAPLPCEDANSCTQDGCDPAIGCLHTPVEGECNDGNACTTKDVCAAGKCQGSVPPDCSDGKACTTDSCEPLQGCLHTPVAPCCGNGVTEAGEECDDGNVAGGDGCSAACKAEPQLSCKALHTLNPALPSGNYAIDPDGGGGAAPFQVWCDMVTDGGGWTRAAFEDFSGATSGWSATNSLTTCGVYGQILGGYGVLAGGSNEKTYSLLGVAHTQARLQLDYIKIDSWDVESAIVRFGGVEIFNHTYCFCSQGCAECGGDDICGGSWPEERSIPVSGTIGHTSNSVVVYGQSTVNQDPSDESWGLDNVAVYVR
jgi:cysteine-rich repeat protein